MTDIIVNLENTPSDVVVDVNSQMVLTNTVLTSLQNIETFLETGLTIDLGDVSLSGAVTVTNFPATQVISGTVTANTGLSQPLTDTQLRASAVPVSGTFWQTTQPVSLANLPALPTGTNVIGSIANTQFSVTQSGTWTVSGTFFPETQPVSATSLPLPNGAATSDNQDTELTLIGELTETAPATDTASSGLNGRLQRLAQRITSLISLFPTSLGAKTATNSFAVTLATDGVASGISNQIGEVQSSPTANTILDRLKIIASALVFGQKTKANSLSVTPASDAIFYNSLPSVTSATILSLTTNATGTTYTAFSSQNCSALDVVNNTGTTLEYRRGATGVALQIPDKSARLILGITNANQIDVRRTDTSNTPVTIHVEAFVL